MAKPPKFWTIDGEGIFVKMDGVVKGVGEAQVRKTVFLGRLYYRNEMSFCQDRLGTNIGKAALKNRLPFSCRTILARRCSAMAPSSRGRLAVRFFSFVFDFFSFF